MPDYTKLWKHGIFYMSGGFQSVVGYHGVWEPGKGSGASPQWWCLKWQSVLEPVGSDESGHTTIINHYMNLLQITHLFVCVGGRGWVVRQATYATGSISCIAQHLTKKEKFQELYGRWELYECMCVCTVCMNALVWWAMREMGENTTPTPIIFQGPL